MSQKCETPLKSEIIHLTHNDFDAFGCILSLSTLNHNQKIFSTNYINIKDVVSDLTNACYKTNVHSIFITDVSFSNNKEVLKELENLAIKLNVPIVLIDHHVYPADFFNDFDYLKVIHNIDNSASKLTYDFLKIKNENLSKIIYMCDTFDIWRSYRQEFLVSIVLNEYFWRNVANTSLEEFSHKVIKNNYKFPSDFKTFYSTYIQEYNTKIESLKKRNLIVSDGFFTVAFIDDYINMLLYQEFQKNTQFVMIANSYGIVRFRFNSNGYLTKDQKEEIKMKIMGTKDIGHLNAFSDKIQNSNFDKIMKKVKDIHDIIINYKI